MKQCFDVDNARVRHYTRTIVCTLLSSSSSTCTIDSCCVCVTRHGQLLYETTDGCIEMDSREFARHSLEQKWPSSWPTNSGQDLEQAFRDGRSERGSCMHNHHARKACALAVAAPLTHARYSLAERYTRVWNRVGIVRGRASTAMLSCAAQWCAALAVLCCACCAPLNCSLCRCAAVLCYAVLCCCAALLSHALGC